MAKSEDAQKASAKKAAEEDKVTFLGMRHFSVGNKSYSVGRGDVLNLDPSSLKHLIEGKSPDDKNADFVRGAVDMKAHDAGKKK